MTPHPRHRARWSLLPALALAALLLAPTVSRLLAPPAPGPWWATLCRTADLPLPQQVLEACGHCSLLGTAVPPPAWVPDLGGPGAAALALSLPAGVVAVWRPTSPAQPRAPPVPLAAA